MCASEDSRFLASAALADARTRLFCEALSYTGARISEALATTPRLLEVTQNQVVFRTLKRRLMFRSVPIPARLMRELAELARPLDPDARLWPWSRQTGWRRVKGVLARAGIEGPQAMPKGIRHKYGISGIIHGVPETMLQELLGHADLSTTALYIRAAGHEKRSIVRRMWQDMP